jgi:hypothetical protein
MMRKLVNARTAFALLAVVALLLPTSGALAKKKGSRYGLEGRVVKFDDARDVLIVKVVKTRVSGGAGTGAVAGKPAPKKSFKRGTDVEFAVVPAGSVLKRTVIKNKDGGGLDTTGTREGFVKALGMVPTDSNVVFSFEKAKAPKPGGPEWDLRIIQLRMSEAEIEERWKEAGDDEETE